MYTYSISNISCYLLVIMVHMLIMLYNCNSQDAQKNYTRTAKELNRIRSEYGELEGSMTKMRLNLQSTSNNSNKDRKRIQELSEEVRWAGAYLSEFYY